VVAPDRPDDKHVVFRFIAHATIQFISTPRTTLRLLLFGPPASRGRGRISMISRAAARPGSAKVLRASRKASWRPVSWQDAVLMNFVRRQPQESLAPATVSDRAIL